MATASYVEQLGEASYLYLECSAVDGFLVVRQDGDAAVEPGQQVTVDLPEAQCHLFDDAGRAFPRMTAAIPSDRIARPAS